MSGDHADDAMSRSSGDRATSLDYLTSQETLAIPLTLSMAMQLQQQQSTLSSQKSSSSVSEGRAEPSPRMTRSGASFRNAGEGSTTIPAYFTGGTSSRGPSSQRMKERFATGYASPDSISPVKESYPPSGFSGMRQRSTMKKDAPPPKSPAGTESSFGWEASSVVSKGTLRRNRGCCTSCIHRYKKVPLGPRCLLYILTGLPFLLTPAILDYFFNIRKDPNLSSYRLVRDYRFAQTTWRVIDISIFVWSVFFSVQWTVYWCLKYGITMLPNFLTQIVNSFWGHVDPSEQLSVMAAKGGTKSRVMFAISFFRTMRPHLLFFLYTLCLMFNFSETFTYEVNPFSTGNSTTAFRAAVVIDTSIEGQADGSILPDVFPWSSVTNTTSSSTAATSQNLTWDQIVLRLLQCIFLLSVVNALQKLFLQIAASKFHSKTYADRIIKNRTALKIINHLNNVRAAHARRKSEEQTSAEVVIPVSDNPSDDARGKGKKKQNRRSDKALQRSTDALESFASGMGRRLAGVLFTVAGLELALPPVTGAVSAIHTKAEAKVLAKMLYETLTERAKERRRSEAVKSSPVLNPEATLNGKEEGMKSPDGKGKLKVRIFAPPQKHEQEKTGGEGVKIGTPTRLVMDDFKPFFSNDSDAKEAFALFDKDENGDVKRSEFRSVVLEIFEERNALEVSLRHSGEALATLDQLLFVVVIIITLFGSLAIWRVDISSFIAAVAAVWVGTLFAIGNTITQAVQNIIFLFVAHPFDVSDRIEIDGQAYIVKEFRLMNTVLKRLDGKELYAPNTTLSSKIIANVRRSGAMTEKLGFHVSRKGTTIAMLKEFQARLLSFVESNPRDFDPKLTVSLDEITDDSCMLISFSIPYKSNWQDGGLIGRRRIAFMAALQNCLMDVGIKLANTTDMAVRVIEDPERLLGE
ncbi:Mechanosensitive ion channel-domain-containing protein [Cladochytrium replicatum]|nr:Mechanosensitive ion channel-domain-containing protein [Cladochytrium replicatum]